jgi:tRNA (guanine10-N2)-dimethyltransferase
MITQSVAILGRQPALGLAELESLYGAEHVSVVSAQVAGLSLPVEQLDFNRLGGSTRIASVVADIPTKLWKDVEKQLIKSATEIASDLPEGKIQLGLSAFDIPITAAKLSASGLTLKKVLRARTSRSIRLTPNPELELNTAQVLHNHLTGQTGIELLIIAAPNDHTIIARTTAVQDIDSYTLRDRGRPRRDARVGMLPPKLAQIIINLANPVAGGVVLDPFCGTGVLLQEALLMGYGAYGSDLEPRMVAYTRDNLDWLNTEYKVDGRHVFLEQADATNFQNHDTFTAVATETYLGRPFTEKPSADVLAQTVTEVNLILKKFLRTIHDQLPAGATLSLAIPAWQLGPNQFKHLPLIDQIGELGYNRVRFEHVRDAQLLYYREDQIVAREILVLTRK